MPATTSPEIRKARRELDNMRSFIRRAGLTGWVKDRNAGGHYRHAFEAIVRVEDAHGVDVAGPLSDRLMELRHEGERAGLIRRHEVGELERRALADIDRENARRIR